jgi:ribA/ribD-fused uncharacterized protein
MTDQNIFFEAAKKLDEKFTFFWSGPFSNWHPSPFVTGGVTYNCSEQHMMAEKARLFGDTESLNRIMSAVDPSDQKRYGRKVKGFDKEKWEKVARDIVYKGCYAKFTQNEDLMRTILTTTGTTLVEASPEDTIWGIGLAEDDPRAQSRETWLGTNWLGETLTKVRDQIALVWMVSSEGVLHQRPYDTMTTTEMAEALSAGNIPNKADLILLSSHFRRYVALKKFAHETEQARQYLPRNW